MYSEFSLTLVSKTKRFEKLQWCGSFQFYIATSLNRARIRDGAKIPQEKAKLPDVGADWCLRKG